ALGLRRLRRSLRAAADAAGEPPGEAPLAAALRDPARLALAGWPAAQLAGRPSRLATGPAPGSPLAAARRAAGLIAGARQAAADGGSAHDVLWAVWEASGLAGVWQAASVAGGSRGATADADLDAVAALFDAAARFTERLPPGSPRLFLESLTGQEIAGDTLAERAQPGEAVAVLTAHRSKGLEWD